MSTFKIKPYENLPSTGSTYYGAIFTFCIKTGAGSATKTQFESDLAHNLIKWSSSTYISQVEGSVTGHIYVDRGDNIPWKNSESINSVKQSVNRTKVKTGVNTYATGIGDTAAGITGGDSVFNSLATPKLYLTSTLGTNVIDVTPVYQKLKYTNSQDAAAYFGRNVNGSNEIFTNPSLLDKNILDTKILTSTDINTSTKYSDRFDNTSLSDYTVYSIVFPATNVVATTTLEINDNDASCVTKLTDVNVGFKPLSLIIQSAAITSAAPTLAHNEVITPPVNPGDGVEYTNNNSMTLITTATQYIQYNVQTNSVSENMYKPGDSNSAVSLPPTSTFAVAAVTSGTPSTVNTFPMLQDPTDNTVYSYATETVGSSDVVSTGIFINCEPFATSTTGDSDHNPGFTGAIQGSEDISTGGLPYSPTDNTKMLVNTYEVDGQTAWFVPILSTNSTDGYTVTVDDGNSTSTTINLLNPTKLITGYGSTTTVTIGDNLADTTGSPCSEKMVANSVTGRYTAPDSITPYLDGQAGSIPNITSFTNSALVVQSENS